MGRGSGHQLGAAAGRDGAPIQTGDDFKWKRRLRTCLFGWTAGPLVAAIVLSAVGRLGRVVFYMPADANLALRELGITLFMASVGIGVGAHIAPHPLTL